MAKREFLAIQELGYLSDRDALDFAQVLYRLEDFCAVVETLEPVIARIPQDRNANWYLGASYERQNRYDKGVEYIQSAVRAGLRAYEAFWHLGYCYHRLGEFEPALRAYEQALAVNPGSVELRQAIVSLLLEKGVALQSADAGLAAEQFQRVLDIDAKNQEARNRLMAMGYTVPRTSHTDPTSGADQESDRG
jgi:tetratricopeptide (TPR) repeat protein